MCFTGEFEDDWEWSEDYEYDEDDDEEDRCPGGHLNSQCELKSVCVRADECSKCGFYQFYP